MGCFAMTDALIEEIYILAREAFQGGQRQFQVHAFPFRLTEANLARHKGNKWHGFWKTLKEGYDTFESTQVPPKVAVCSRQYLLNANFFGQEAIPDPEASCPAYKKIQPQPFDPFNGGAPTSIQANAQPQTEAPRVSAVADPSRPVEPGVKPLAAQALKSAGQSQPQQPAAPVLAGAAPDAAAPQNLQPVAATYAPPPVVASTPPAEEKKSVETRGLHNVVQSGKSDMIVPPPASPSTQFTYGQANTAGSGAAFR
jgi:hypothetical protein